MGAPEVPVLMGRRGHSLRLLCPYSVVGGVGVSGTPLPRALLLKGASGIQTSDASCLKTEGPSARPARASSQPSPSPSPGQDCENYITLLEKQGDRLLICGTNARRPSCWSLVRKPSLWAGLGGLLPPV